jgi:hypothetical protein
MMITEEETIGQCLCNTDEHALFNTVLYHTGAKWLPSTIFVSRLLQQFVLTILTPLSPVRRLFSDLRVTGSNPAPISPSSSAVCMDSRFH